MDTSGSNSALTTNMEIETDSAVMEESDQKILIKGIPIKQEVKLKKLPFYNDLAVLLNPSPLVPCGSLAQPENRFYFHLTAQQAADITSSTSGNSQCIKQVQLRFCLLETTCEQDDCFPLNVHVRVNNTPCSFPKVPFTSGYPLDITKFLVPSRMHCNNVSVSWNADDERVYALSIMFVEKRSASELLRCLKKRPVQSRRITLKLIAEALTKLDEEQGVDCCVRFSFTCPIGRGRIITPARATTCKHVQCFDALAFLTIGGYRNIWNCPVCDEPVLFENIVIDGYLQGILDSEESFYCKEILLHEDAEWSNIGEFSFCDRERTRSYKEKQRVQAEIIDLTTDDYIPSTSRVRRRYKSLRRFRFFAGGEWDIYDPILKF